MRQTSRMGNRSETYCEENIFQTGIGYVVVCRHKSGGRVETGSFLVDVHCLGVKDAFFRVYEEEGFRAEFLPKIFPGGIPEAKPASWGRKLVEDAVRYARDLGFAPHPDYKKGAKVFGGVDASECDEEFIFGSEGQPLYVQGPYDGHAKAERILATLRAKLGNDGFHYIVPLGEGFDEMDDEGFARDFEDDDGRPDRDL